MNQPPTTIHDWMSYMALYPQMEAIPPQHAVAFVRFLIQHEVSAGGPYVFNTPHDKKINTFIRRYIARQKNSLPIGHRTSLRAPWNIIYKNTLLEIGNTLSPTMQAKLKVIFQALSNTDTSREISNFPSYFYASLAKRPVLLENQLEALNIANCYVWLAYSLADKIIDNNSHADLAAAAHYFSHSAFAAYEAVGLPVRCLHFCTTLTDKAVLSEQYYNQKANLKVSRHSIKFATPPSTTDAHTLLGKKSYAHLAGPLAILELSNYADSEKTVVTRFLEHYCAMRQLNDDLHDWKDDLVNKHITYVVAQLLEDHGLSISTNPHQEVLTQLEHTFFTQTLPSCIDAVIQEYTTATHKLKTSGVFRNQTFINKVVEPHKVSLEIIQKQHRYAQAFLKTYAESLEESAK